MVSRDGSSEYASAITKGAPQARQLSDRWHLVKNLAACVSVQLTQSLTQLRRAEQAEANTTQERQPLPQHHSHPRTRAEKRTQQARQAERTARYEQIMALQQQGMKSIEIAAFMGMAPRTVREWLDRGDIPYSGSRKPRARLIDPYQIYLRERWQQGCQKASTIGKRTQSKRVSRVTTSNLSVLGDVRSIELLCPQKRFPISDQTA